jgi:hypothetical protein
VESLDRAAVVRGYRTFLLFAVACAMGLLVVGFRHGGCVLGWVFAGLGAALLIGGVVGLVRSGRADARVSDQSILFRGLVGGQLEVPWSEVEYAGWLWYPPVAAYGVDVFLPVIRVRSRRWPIILPVSAGSLAKRADVSASQMLDDFGRLCSRSATPFKQRVPDFNPYLYSWGAAASVIGLTIGTIILLSRFC